MSPSGRKQALATFLAKRDRGAFFQAQAEKARTPAFNEGLDANAMFANAFALMSEAIGERPKLALIMAAEARCIQAVRRGDMANSAIVTARHFP